MVAFVKRELVGHGVHELSAALFSNKPVVQTQSCGDVDPFGDDDLALHAVQVPESQKKFASHSHAMSVVVIVPASTLSSELSGHVAHKLSLLSSKPVVQTQSCGDVDPTKDEDFALHLVQDDVLLSQK